jgi:hypothetical protein
MIDALQGPRFLASRRVNAIRLIHLTRERLMAKKMAATKTKKKTAKKKTVKRTTLRSSKGKKLYAVRDPEGKFKDIQTYKRAHGSDIKRKAKAEK